MEGLERIWRQCSRSCACTRAPCNQSEHQKQKGDCGPHIGKTERAKRGVRKFLYCGPLPAERRNGWCTKLKSRQYGHAQREARMHGPHEQWPGTPPSGKRRAWQRSYRATLQAPAIPHKERQQTDQCEKEQKDVHGGGARCALTLEFRRGRRPSPGMTGYASLLACVLRAAVNAREAATAKDAPGDASPASKL